MLKNYIKIALRNLLNNKTYSLINISGLAIEIACFMLIYLFVKDELGYDKFHSKADRIYRLTEKINMEGQGGEFSSSNPFPVMKAMLTDYPEYIEELIPESPGLSILTAFSLPLLGEGLDEKHFLAFVVIVKGRFF